MEMKSLFEPPLAHTNDPITSFEAGDKMVKNGWLNKQENDVLWAIFWYVEHYAKDFTAKELTHGGYGSRKLNYFTIQRRLSGLQNKSKIERTGEKRDGCCVWRLI